MPLIYIKTLQDMRVFSGKIGRLLKKQDVLFLKGNLGVGKTEFARGLIQLITTETQEVPSPTFSLVHVYETMPPIWHFDLYRLEHPEDVWEIGLEEALHEGISLIEWPDRLPIHVINSPLIIEIDILPDSEERIITLAGIPDWLERLRKEEIIHD